MNQALFSYLSACKTPFHTIAHTASLLRAAGYQPLSELQPWVLTPGKGYFVTRGDSSLIAFRMPQRSLQSFSICAAHSDSPCLKLRENPQLLQGDYVRLCADPYGGMLRRSWMDRPLSVAGRVLLNTPQGLVSRLVDFAEPCLILPSVAIHLDRSANEHGACDPASDLQPVFGTRALADDFSARLAALAGAAPEQIFGSDLFVYLPDAGVQLGDLIAAPRLDDLQCAFAALQGFLAADAAAMDSAPVFCLFDHEEVGSLTQQGAASTFLRDTLQQIFAGAAPSGAPLQQIFAASFLLSCDNAHAVHPNHPEYADGHDAPRLNRGIVIKQNANQKYATDAQSTAMLRLLCQAARVPVQSYCNRPGTPGGSTLGNLIRTQLSIPTADLGLPQLAMHSALETAGAEDTAYLCTLCRTFFSHRFSHILQEDGSFAIQLLDA